MKTLLVRSPDCIPVAGATRGVVYDLGRRRFYILPLDFINLIKERVIDSDRWFKLYLLEEERDTLRSFKKFLVEKELVFTCPDHLAENITELCPEFEPPGHITNAIIDYEKDSPYDLETFVKAASAIGARHFLIRSFTSDLNFSDLKRIFGFFENSAIRSFEIIAKYNKLIYDGGKEIIQSEARCKSIVLHSAPEVEYIPPLNGFTGIVASTSQKINSAMDCRHNSIHYMNVNVELFMEAQKTHAYYYKKVCIDKDGLIKNCNSHTRHYGRFLPETLLETVLSPEFRKLWFVKKDETAICSDCEFRYMCVDSRELFQHEDGRWRHKEPCEYDPYSAKWINE
jgi:SPASM domain peptide maturase of grasp-with-spasm system